ncbi:hypothetical protein CTA2_3365 [Colletotrichum tanaceti]|uniref:Uncharacterized protein n=1 Tax=Colletotrichum tanaceti TaxID=1306861 RepID=A0A4U6XHZ6_9PEZI|nr:hypothetical protein CTA2_3365 [Colletotrichum tanaceti]TKW53687.1 hypothetical protein CTA1_4338 [Colletotrichum tanaceti]
MRQQIMWLQPEDDSNSGPLGSLGEPVDFEMSTNGREDPVPVQSASVNRRPLCDGKPDVEDDVKSSEGGAPLHQGRGGQRHARHQEDVEAHHTQVNRPLITRGACDVVVDVVDVVDVVVTGGT